MLIMEFVSPVYFRYCSMLFEISCSVSGSKTCNHEKQLVQCHLAPLFQSVIKRKQLNYMMKMKCPRAKDKVVRRFFLDKKVKVIPNRNLLLTKTKLTCYKKK